MKKLLALILSIVLVMSYALPVSAGISSDLFGIKTSDEEEETEVPEETEASEEETEISEEETEISEDESEEVSDEEIETPDEDSEDESEESYDEASETSGEEETESTDNSSESLMDLILIRHKDVDEHIVSDKLSCVTFYEFLTVRDVAAYSMLAERFDEIRQSYLKSRLGDAQCLREMIDDQKGSNPSYAIQYASETTCTVVRADESVVSFYMDYYYYGGGAHPISEMVSYNIAPETGEDIELSDVLTDKASMVSLVFERLEPYSSELYNSLDSNGQMVYVNQVNSAFEDNTQTFWLTADGIVFYYAPYMIAPYAAGDFEILIPYSECAELINSDYVPEDKLTFVKVGYYKDIPVDVDGDGTEETVYVTASKSIEENSSKINVRVSDISKEFSLSGILSAVYLLENAEHRYFLYAQVEDDDEEYISVYDLTASGAEYVDDIDIVFGSGCTTSADSLLMKDTEPVFGDIYGYMSYSLDDEGLPVTEDDAYMFLDLSGQVFKLTKKLAAELLEDGERTGEFVTLKKNSKLELLGTDGEGYLLGRTGDGEEIIIDMDPDTKKINGVKASKYFKLRKIVSELEALEEDEAEEIIETPPVETPQPETVYDADRADYIYVYTQGGAYKCLYLEASEGNYVCYNIDGSIYGVITYGNTLEIEAMILSSGVLPYEGYGAITWDSPYGKCSRYIHEGKFIYDEERIANDFAAYGIPNAKIPLSPKEI